MPQFDTYTFCSQIIWVCLCFTFLYLTFTYYVLPSIAATLKARNAMLSASVGGQSYSVSSILLKNSQVAHISENLQAGYSELGSLHSWYDDSNLSASDNALVLQNSSNQLGLVYSISHLKHIQSELILLAWASAIKV